MDISDPIQLHLSHHTHLKIRQEMLADSVIEALADFNIILVEHCLASCSDAVSSESMSK